MIRRIFKLVAVIVLAVVALFTRGKGSLPTPRPSDKRTRWKTWGFRAAITLPLLALGGFLLTASGIISIKASSKHWPVTHWFLNFAKERSVATHSLGIKAPPLDAEWQILKGAGHFDMGCRPCHGSPGTSRPRIPFAMTPNPPPLAIEVAEWDPAELFYIVKHGIKFTGMPAWPAKNRDDEVWAVVAFLQELPRLNKIAYEQLVRGKAESSKPVPVEDLLPPRAIHDILTENCNRCHGMDGLGRGNAAFPKLAGQKFEYLYAAMKAYAEGERHSGIMQPIAAALDERSIHELARYYSSLPPGPAIKAADLAAAKRGADIASRGIPSKRVAACYECHGPAPTDRNAFFPHLATQFPEYLALQLELFSKRNRGGSHYSHLMHYTADGLSPEERNDVAHYYASLSFETKEDVKK